MDEKYEIIAREFIRALRGKQSQPVFSRRLGYRTNVIYMWEAGRTFPTASTTMKAAQLVGIDIRDALLRFYRVQPEWMFRIQDLTSPIAICQLLEDLRADRPIMTLAMTIGCSRFAVARWLRGDAQPRLPDFLRLIDGSTMRLLDFIAVFVNPERLPSVRKSWHNLETSRRAAYEFPWTHAVLRALELQAYQRMPHHKPGWIAKLLDIDEAEETQCLKLLKSMGQIHMHNGRWVPTEVRAIDTRRDPEAAAKLRQFWAKTGLERAGQDSEAVLSFNLGTLAERDIERVRELHRRYFSELRDIISNSEPGECLLLANVQLVRLG